jgi:hypothetical protein
MCKKLETLVLDETNITDEGLRELEKCPSLALVFLRNTHVSKKAMDELRSLRPKVQVETEYRMEVPPLVGPLVDDVGGGVAPK